MDNNKKLFEELLKTDGIDPKAVTESEREVFKKMLDSEQKRMKRLSRRYVGVMLIFVLTMLGLCLYENILEELRIPFVVAAFVVLAAILIVRILYEFGYARKMMESSRIESKLYCLVHGKHNRRGLILVGQKDGKRHVYWIRIILISAGLWLLISLGLAGVFSLICQRWIYTSSPWFHIFYCTAVSLSFVIPILYTGLKTPLDELTEVKTKQKHPKPPRRPDIWRTIMTSNITKFALAAVIIIGVLLGVNPFGGSIDGASIAFAEVMRDFQQQLQTNDYIHLIITKRKPFFSDDFNFGDVVSKMEIWVQRPFNMRNEITWQTNKRPDVISPTPITYIYNREGEYTLNHRTRRWGFRDADLINVHRGVAYRDLSNKTINNYLKANFYAKYNWQEDTYGDTYGTAVDYTELDGERITIYDFSEYDGKRHKCWLRDKDSRLLRMEVYTDVAEKPVEIYEVLSYDAPLSDHIFEASIPKDYVNGQLLGYEDQPQFINPQVATVVTSEESAKFYRLSSESGQTDEEIIAANVPAFEINVGQSSVLTVTIRQPAEPKDSKPYTWHTTCGSVVGSYCYGVLINSDNTEKGRIDIMDVSDYKGQGQIIFEFVIYRTDYRFCKVAFDADGDGQMDVWCQVPSEEVVSVWRQALIKD